MVALVSPFLFGTARLSFERLTTSLPVFLIFCVGGLGSRYQSYDLLSLLSVIGIFPMMTTQLMTLGGGITLDRHKESLDWFTPKEICCSIKPVKKLEQEIKTIATRHSIHRPMIAVSDVGYLTFLKEYNVIDLGKLAHPLLAKENDTHKIRTYFFEIIAPDVVELHGTARMYRQSIKRLSLRSDVRTRTQSHRAMSNRWQDMIRKDMSKDSGSQERELMMSLQSNITWGIFETERDRCRAETPSDCHYIERTIYRFTPELMSQYPEHVDEIQQVVQRLWNP